MYYLFKYSAPVLVVPELVETGAGRGQQHDVSGCGDRRGASQRGFKRLGVVDFHAFDLGLDLLRGRANGIDPLDPLPQQFVELRVVAVFVLAAQNQVDICRERFQGLDGRIDIGGLGVVVIFNAANGRDIFQPVLDRFEVLVPPGRCVQARNP